PPIDRSPAPRPTMPSGPDSRPEMRPPRWLMAPSKPEAALPATPMPLCRMLNPPPVLEAARSSPVRAAWPLVAVPEKLSCRTSSASSRAVWLTAIAAAYELLQLAQRRTLRGRLACGTGPHLPAHTELRDQLETPAGAGVVATVEAVRVVEVEDGLDRFRLLRVFRVFGGDVEPLVGIAGK